MSVKVRFSAHSGLILLSTVILALFIFLIPAAAVRAAEADDPGRLVKGHFGVVSNQEAEEIEDLEEEDEEEIADDEEEEETTGDAAKGRDIFTGSLSLQNGGAACISCHNVNGVTALGGGDLAKDLTGTYSNLGDAGLTSILKMTPFPLMKAIYEERPLEDSEVADLVAFLEEADAEQSTAGQNPFAFIMIGIAGLLLIVIILQITWRGRLSGVRQTLVKGGSK
jgi:mono/diheme cytochrome c family protein